MTPQMTCCVPGCGREAGGLSAGPSCERLCAVHFSRLSEASRRALQSASRRLARLQASFGTQATFDGAVARGRYLQFCELIEMAQDRLDQAWSRATAEAIAAASRESAARPASVVSARHEFAG